MISVKFKIVLNIYRGAVLYLSIYYKNQKIDWILCQFFEPDASRIIKEILKKTSGTKIISYGNLYCPNKKELKKIFKILKKEFFLLEKHREKLPNLLVESIKQFFEYQNDD